MLRRCPFFMASNQLFRLGAHQRKLEKTSKQTQDFVLHFIVFACLGEREARAAVLASAGNIQARKNKQA
jgi:hypothetical protein